MGKLKFVSWVANKAGLSTSQSPKTASTDTGMAFFKNKGEFGIKGKYTPKRNDTVYFKSGGRSHVGIVKAVKNGKNGLEVMDSLYIHNEDGSYQKEILEIFN